MLPGSCKHQSKHVKNQPFLANSAGIYVLQCCEQMPIVTVQLHTVPTRKKERKKSYKWSEIVTFSFLTFFATSFLTLHPLQLKISILILPFFISEWYLLLIFTSALSQETLDLMSRKQRDSYLIHPGGQKPNLTVNNNTHFCSNHTWIFIRLIQFTIKKHWLFGPFNGLC